MTSATSLPIAIIGTGFGGLCMAIHLKKAGIDSFTIFEKGVDVGGCWRDNTYPGAACDVPSHLYSFSFEPKSDWSRKFAPQPEIFAYLRHCADKYGLRRHIRFNTEVAAASYDDARALWTVTLANGERFEARAVVAATGQLSRPAYPKLPGIETFKGKAFHSARWDHEFDLAGKRVAVVGTGASAIQFVPEVAKVAGSLTLFQRTPPWIMRKADRAYSRLEKFAFRHLPLARLAERGRIYASHEWRYSVIASRNKVAQAFYEGIARLNLHRSVPDPDLRAQLKPDYAMGCNRILISANYYAALSQSNVQVMTDAIAEVRPQGIVTKDGQLHEVDAIIYGTGFAATEFLAPMHVSGRDGLELNQAWRDGAQAHLGMTVSGFPNFFMLYGPNTNLGHNSIVFMIESQVRYVMQCVRKLKDGARALDVRAEVQNTFNERLQERLRASVWGTGCNSWYKTASGRNTNNWGGYTLEYRAQTRRVNFDDFVLQS